MLENRIREWLMSQPGLIEGDSPEAVMSKALAMSRVECSADDFKAVLDRAGFRVSMVRDKCRLALPDVPINSYPARRRP